VPARSWSSDPSALELLQDGGPFNVPSFRQGLIAAYPSYRDVTVGAIADDGTRAAVAVLITGSAARSLPLAHGGVVASRWLTAWEMQRLLETVRRWSGARTMIVRSVPAGDRDRVGHVGGRIVGWTSVVLIGKGTDPERAYAFKARRSIRRAEAAGATVRASSDPSAFLGLYAPHSIEHEVRFPDALIQTMGEAGDLRCFDVWHEGAAVASAVAVVGPSWWEGWLLAQDDRGRAIDGNYLAVHALLQDASRQDVPAVDLGVSPGLPGVAHFKRRFGAIQLPVVEDRAGRDVRRIAAGAARRIRKRIRRLRA
jgi:hypothetical protein